MTNTTEQWLTIAEAAEVYGISTKTVRRRITDGTLAAKRIGPRLIRVSAKSLAALANPMQHASRAEECKLYEAGNNAARVAKQVTARQAHVNAGWIAPE